MRTFEYVRATSVSEAVEAVSAQPEAVFLAGGTNLVDHLKLGVAAPSRVVDVSRLPLDAVEETDGGLRIGAAVSNAAVAADERVRRDYPVLARALLAGASGQLRNQASTGGNLFQRTRCTYFQDVSTLCNKRSPGTGCPALSGHEEQNALLGGSPHCVAVHPSDMTTALAALDAQVVVAGPAGERRLPLLELHREPGDRPDRDTTLAHGELVTALELGQPAPVSGYRKVRDRASYAFALVSVAAVLREDGPRIAWGGVATRPWRASLAEEALRGAPLDEELVTRGVESDLAAATTNEHNAYKVDLLRAVTTRLVLDLAGQEKR